MGAAVDIAIIGGGIAGLRSAAACRAAGVTAHVFEAAPAISPASSPLGTSLSLWPNAMACLARWGIKQPIADSGQEIAQIAWRRPDGRPYFVQALAGLYQDLGHNGICIRRSDLHRHLLAALDPSQVHLGHRLISAMQQVGQVHLAFAGGTRLAARQVIGADGLSSVLRSQVQGAQDPIYAGYGAWLGLSCAPSPNPMPNEGCEYIGAQARMGVFETGRDTRYWFVIARSATTARSAAPARAEDCAPYLRDYPEPLRQIPLQSDPASIVYASFFDRPATGPWGRGNITLTGDAMHPFVPNLGQGACQAIEDAHTLACGLARGLRGDALNDWMKSQRRARVRYMQRISRRLGQLAQSPWHAARASLNLLGLPLLGLPPFSSIMRAELKKQFTGAAQ